MFLFVANNNLSQGVWRRYYRAYLCSSDILIIIDFVLISTEIVPLCKLSTGRPIRC